MAFSSPTKIPRVEGEEFSRIREQFCLLTVSIRFVMLCDRFCGTVFTVFVFCVVFSVG